MRQRRLLSSKHKASPPACDASYLSYMVMLSETALALPRDVRQQIEHNHMVAGYIRGYE